MPHQLSFLWKIRLGSLHLAAGGHQLCFRTPVLLQSWAATVVLNGEQWATFLMMHMLSVGAAGTLFVYT